MQPCQVLAYEPAVIEDRWRRPAGGEVLAGSYTVKFPAQKQVGSAKQAPGLVKQVRRINLCFDQEDHPHFLRRVAYAEAAREETKSVIRFEHYINSQPGAGSSIRPIQPETLTGVHQRVMSTIPAALKAQLEAETLKKQEDELAGDVPTVPMFDMFFGLTSSVVQAYTWSMKKQVFLHSVAADPEVLAQYFSLKLPPLPPKVEPPYYAKMVLGAVSQPYAQSQMAIGEAPCISLDEVCAVLGWVSTLWEGQLQDKRFVSVASYALPGSGGGTTDVLGVEGLGQQLQLPCKLSKFDEIQSKHCADLTTRLADAWHTAVSECMTDSLQDAFDFFEADRDRFNSGPLKRLFKLTDLRMSGHLRHLVVETTAAWETFLTRFAPAGAAEERPSDAARPFQWKRLPAVGGLLEIRLSIQVHRAPGEAGYRASWSIAGNTLPGSSDGRRPRCRHRTPGRLPSQACAQAGPRPTPLTPLVSNK
jgi:hypothetical protein